jgi:hypothetical protein
VGVNVKAVALAGNIEPSGSWNGMCTHRIKLEDEKNITRDLIAFIKMAYDQVG